MGDVVNGRDKGGGRLQPRCVPASGRLTGCWRMFNDLVVVDDDVRRLEWTSGSAKNLRDRG
jgi:hypothetical protein